MRRLRDEAYKQSGRAKNAQKGRSWILSLVVTGTLSLGAVSGLAQTVPMNQMQSDEANTVEIFQKVSAAVVNISSVQSLRVPFSRSVQDVPAGSGTGWLYDKLGHIVTNYHVVQNGTRLSVSFKNGATAEARLVGVEPRKDVAVLRVKLPAGLAVEPLSLSNTKNLLVGQKAVAIGSPFGLEQTLTRGTVSALGRSIQGIGGVEIRDMVQTDAPINPGNSGGPLLDSSGSLIGMNTIIFSKSGSSSGIGFAVPANTIKRVVNQIIAHGRVQQPGMGIAAVPDTTAQQLGISGVIILEVLPGGPADKAGMKGTVRTRRGEIVMGDIIKRIGGASVENYDDLYNILDEYKVGDEVKVSFLRDGKERTVSVKLIDLQEA